MESLLGKPIYKYNKSAQSQITIHGRTNCCFISSFQIQMKKHFNNFPDLKVLLELLYPNQSNAYTHFANDFPAKWFKLKNYLANKDPSWIEKLDNVLLHICLPHQNNNKCIQLTFIDLNKINTEEVAQGNYQSLEASFSDEYDESKTIISIKQYYNHFEPVDIDFSYDNETVKTLDEVGISEDFFM
jgi:hypothetical protein